jgi:hypothetical protein
MNPTCKTTVTLNLILILLLMSSFVQKPKKSQPADQQPGIFRAAMVKTDITPDNPQYLVGYQERKSEGINDHIFQKVLLLDDSKSQFVLASTEICILSRIEYDQVAKRVKDEFGIDQSNFWWSTTHTHSAPEVGEPGIYQIYMGERNKHELDKAYTSFIEEKLIEGIREARKNLAPARLGSGWGYSQANINRRAVDVDGKASLGLNPDGPVDRKIGLLKIEKTDGSPIALVANYPIHGTVMSGSNLLISGDAPGIVSEYVESKTGSPVIFINGAAGNLAPVYSVYPSPRAGHLGEFRVLLGDKIIDAYNKITGTTDKVSFKAESVTVETPRKAEMGWPENWGKYSKKSANGQNMVLLPIGLLKINNNIAIWSAPVELFCEISNEARDMSVYPFTFYFGYTNGWFGYFAAEKEFIHEGYETRVTPLTPAAQKDLISTLAPYLSGNPTAETSKKPKK